MANAGSKKIAHTTTQTVLNAHTKVLIIVALTENMKKKRRHIKMLSRDCDNCFRKYIDCGKRFFSVQIGEFVYCPSGERHLVDGE